MKNKTKVIHIIAAIIALFVGELIYVLQPIEPEESKQFVKNLANLQQKNMLATKGVPLNAINEIMNSPEAKKFTTASITTNKGVIEIELSSLTPNTTKNFGVLANSEFYNGVRFHRVIKDIMIQTGDPLTKNLRDRSAWGTGGPGYKFNDELSGNEQYTYGTVAMANVGPNTNGSQFFIITAKPGYPLPPNYTVFGKVVKGIETINAIQNVETDSSNRPIADVIIQKVEAR